MRVISFRALRDFWTEPKNPADAERYLRAWYKLASDGTWHNFGELRSTFRSADAVGDCIVFDVGNNRIRLIGRVRYADDARGGIVYVLAVLTHAEYDENKWPDDCGCHVQPKTKAKARNARTARKPRKKK